MTLQPKYGYLVIVSRSGTDGKAFPMHHSRVTIGRKETCDIRMQRPQVSKEHCIIRAVRNEIVLTNLSENGAAVNANVLSVNQQQTLRPGDLITIVGRSLRYEAPSKNAVQPIGEISRQVSALATVRKLDRRQNTHPLGNSERITRKIRLWDEHYSDLRSESPPPGLLDDDPFGGADAASTSLFSRMAARVERGMGNVDSMASPLKRTVSSGGSGVNNGSRMNRRDLMDMLDGTIATGNANAGVDDDEEVLTEPEPEPEPELELEPEAVTVNAVDEVAAVTALPTPLSVLRSRSVRFGPPLSPEVFDTQAPPSTPLRRGTPMPIKRISSILRPNQPGFMDSIPETAESPTVSRKSAFDIESPVSNRVRNRRRRSLRTARKERRATMEPLAMNGASTPLSPSSSSPQMLLVRTKPQQDAKSLMELAKKRKERRKTAPAMTDIGGSASVPSIAEIAAALGEDVPPAFNLPAKKEAKQAPSSNFAKDDDYQVAKAEKMKEEAEVDEFGALPLPASALEPLLLGSQKPLGLADAFRMTEKRTTTSTKSGIDGEEDEQGNNVLDFSSEALLEEQATLQARFSGARADISERLGQLSVDSISRRRRRQTTAMVFELPLAGIDEAEKEETGTSSAAVSADDTDSLIAHRQRLRRMQERKRRRQTVAELKRRRSSWRGWTGGSPLLTQSPPLLSDADHVGHMPSSDIEAEVGGGARPAASLASSASAFNSIRMPSKEKAMTTTTKTTVYPPKPIPIDEGWEIVDAQQPSTADRPSVDTNDAAEAAATTTTAATVQRKESPLPEPQPEQKKQQQQLQKNDVGADASLPSTPKYAPRPTNIPKQAAATPSRSAGGRKRRLTSENKKDATTPNAATPRRKRQQEEQPLATPPVTRSAKRARRTAK
ncbi:antigen identified by monoclonal antibody Ki-67 [Coemansia sp. RSA 1933]|nr:antigen identified by monoclonal antibody Ki-67 [Coemansia sp. RSA 1933]